MASSNRCGVLVSIGFLESSPYPARHCEERKRRSNPELSALSGLWMASLAMTPWRSIAAIQPNSMTPEVMDFRSPKLPVGATLGAGLLLRLRRGPHRHMPDILGIF